MKRLLLTELAVLLFRETKWERRYGVITAADARMRDVKAYIDMNFRGKLGLEEGEDRVFQVGTKSGFESENTFWQNHGDVAASVPESGKTVDGSARKNIFSGFGRKKGRV